MTGKIVGKMFGAGAPVSCRTLSFCTRLSN